MQISRWHHLISSNDAKSVKICASIAPQVQKIPEETLVTAVNKAQDIKKKTKPRKVSDRKGIPSPVA